MRSANNDDTQRVMEEDATRLLQRKKRHHYVWAKYLEGWGNGTQNVYYTTKNGKIACDSVRGIAVDDYFYRVTTLTKRQIALVTHFSSKSPQHIHDQRMVLLNDFLQIQRIEEIYSRGSVRSDEIERQVEAMRCNALENVHAVHEANALPLLSALAEENVAVLDDSTNMCNFLMFIGHQFARTKSFRDGVLRRPLRHTALEAEMSDTMSHAWWFFSFMFGMNMGCSLFAERRTSTHALLINDTQVPFVTSDQPVVNVHPDVSETEFIAPKSADIYYPISPRIAYMIGESGRYKPGKNVVVESLASELNTKVAAQAIAHIIGNSEDAVRPFRKYVARRHRKVSPGAMQAGVDS